MIRTDLTKTSVVWLANNVTPYHRARADEFTKLWPGSFAVLALSGMDALSALNGPGCDRALVTTLFPNMELQQLGKGVLRRAILQHLEAGRPDVCCLNGWGLPGTAAMLDWAIRNRVPCVLMSDSNEHDLARAWWREEAKRRFVAQCGAALVAGAWSREYLIKLGMPSQSVFDGYDVVDNEHFRAGAERARLDPVRTRASLNLPRDYFLACARFEPKKNLRGLIEAYGRYVRQAGPEPWRLVVVGDGPSRADLVSLATKLGIGEKVVFRGLAGYEELPGIYGLAKAFVHASTTEQWGLVVNEAMAAGLPVLVSERCGCVAELVKDGVSGFIFNPRDTEGIAQRMLSLYQDGTLLQRMGQESSAIIAEWGVERFARNLRRAVEYALDEGPRKSGIISKAVIGLMAS